MSTPAASATCSTSQAMCGDQEHEVVDEPMFTVHDEPVDMDIEFLEPSVISSDVSTQTKGCAGCTRLKEDVRQWGNKYITLKEKYDAVMNQPAKVSTSIQCDRINEACVNVAEEQPAANVAGENVENDVVDDIQDLAEDDITEDAGEFEVLEEEPEYHQDTGLSGQDGNYKPDTDTDTGTETDTDNEDSTRVKRPRLQDDNLRTESKHIVFLSKLLLLFQFCHTCKTDKPLVETREVGTMAVVHTTCQNPKCPQKENVWHSQPNMPGTRIPAGNFLLCFAILLAGGSASKVIQIFSHMGLACISLSTFFQHQRTKLACDDGNKRSKRICL
ncbi:hypothetical protein OS493_036999 [Desmophyllum pertusum]|uniref:Uncharacterized protein n=1 Tax=Desmophyllum pertusum TaxID=174260 RepID=A0A9X0CMZ4_9CNID|nr:hypothetical protein OS493_036999 [Desmophyllum pertusum]